MPRSARRIRSTPSATPARVGCALAWALACGACSSGPTEAAQMRRVIEPCLQDVATYDRWARRLGLADGAFRSSEALNEAAFAPLRRQPRVAAAWIERAGPDARALHHPDDAPALPDDGWVRVVTEALGELHAQRRRLSIGEREREFTLVRRSRPAPGDATLHVTIACAPPAADEE